MLDFYIFMISLSIVAIPIGLIFPPLVLFWLPKRNRTRKAVMGYFGIAFIVFATLGGISTEELTDEQIAVKETEKVEAQDEKEAKKVAKVEAKEVKAKKKAVKKEDSKKLSGLTAHFIDVGQGDAILLEYSEGKKDYHILIDSGDWKSEGAVNYLEQHGVTHLDLLVGTHPHADHIGKMDTIIEKLDVEEVWMSGDESTSDVFFNVMDAIDNNGGSYEEPKLGDEYTIGSLDIKVLAPVDDTPNSNLNDGSIVFKAIYGDVSFLFTGDAELKSEKTMVGNNVDLQADILKVGHHGSDTSSSDAFVKAVNPDVGVISVAKKNSYGHPNKSVIDRMNNYGIDLYSTHTNGTVIIKTDGKTYDITTKEDGNVTPSSKGDKKKEIKPKKDKPKTSSSGCIDINTASEEQLHDIINIGKERSKLLIDGRPYKDVKELERIKGIGPDRIKEVEDQGKACVN